LQARAGHQTQVNLLQGQRDIQLAKMERDRQDALNVLGMANQHMNSEVNRNIGAYGAYLQGQGQNAGELFRAYGSQTDAFNQHNDTALRAQQLALQNTLGQGGLNLQQQQLAQNASQFGQNYQLSQAALMNDMIMGRANHGLNLAQLQQMAQNGMFNTIFGGR
ncbi:MAG TPA: hypothetical protein VEI97_06865, partial [bacterium]|nr:hypothetical protein [bacterium]